MVKAKKHLGQHFLKDSSIAQDIAEAIKAPSGQVLEIGPGTGMLTQFLIKQDSTLKCVELDEESITYLNQHYPSLDVEFKDYLKTRPDHWFDGEFSLVGNFPYNISGPIMFSVFENRDKIVELVGMFQKEFAARICADSGNKSYGILSVLMQSFYDCEYLFTVDEHVFNPPPKVKSGVIRLTRKTENLPQSTPKELKKIVKAAFNQRRKTLRNALKSFILDESLKQHPYMGLRAEQLSLAQFDELCIALKNQS